MRRIFFSIITGVLTGGLILGVGWATTGLIPVDEAGSNHAGRTKVRKEGPQATEELQATAQAQAEFTGQRLPEGQFLVGASRVFDRAGPGLRRRPMEPARRRVRLRPTRAGVHPALRPHMPPHVRSPVGDRRRRPRHLRPSVRDIER